MAAWRLEVATRSDIGCVRTNNEDALGVVAEKAFFVVADGLGGHQAGEVASNYLIQSLLRMVRSSPQPANCEAARQLLVPAITQANLEIYDMGQQNSTMTGMGTTCCALWICGHSACLVNVGDSRIYRLRDSVLEQITRDHIMDMQELHPVYTLLSGSTGRVLTRAIGGRPEIEVDFNSAPIKEKDLFLLCSDGLTDMVTGDAIRECLTSTDTVENQASQLVELAKVHGGVDNISLILVKIDGISG
jgi:protein phosphatase